MKLVLVQPRLSLAGDATNLDVVLRLVEPKAADLGPDDVLLLPEHVVPGASRDAYVRDVARLAARLGCTVVGGSHHRDVDDGRVNAGSVVDSRGNVLGEYEKLRPYAEERRLVRVGERLGEIAIGGVPVLVLVCADFWFVDLFERARTLPSLVLVPAHSVTRKPTPTYSRALWAHLAIARAYELGVYVGISDWDAGSRTGPLPPAGVAGFADPTQTDPAAFFAPVDPEGVAVVDVDLVALDRFRADRVARGFFWRPAP